MARVAAAAGVPFAGVWLDVAPAVMAERLRRRTSDASDATIDVLERQLRREPGRMDWHRVDAAAPPVQLAARALASLRDSAPRPSPDSRQSPPAPE